MHDRKAQNAAQVRGKVLQPVQAVRKAEGFSQKVWNVQDLFQNTGASGSDPRCDKIKLVEVRK